VRGERLDVCQDTCDIRRRLENLSEKMAMDAKLLELARAMIRTERNSRMRAVAKLMQTVRTENVNSLQNSRFPVVVDSVAAPEYEERSGRYLGIVKRVAEETETPWTEPAASAALHLLNSELITDWEELLTLMRTTVGPSNQMRFDELDATKNRIAQVLENEFRLLVVRQERPALPLHDLLLAPRYAAPLVAWKKSNQFLQASPPDNANAAKEAISSVEALARILVGDQQATLGECIRILRSEGIIEGAEVKGLEEAWGISNQTPGVRHSASPGDLDGSNARYVVDLAQAALRLLLVRDVLREP
jgi:hypothetical protein